MNERKVQRVLVMLDYGPEDPDTGEVFDLTTLARELSEKGGELKHSDIQLTVSSRQDYSGSSPWPLKTGLSWRVSVNFEASGYSGHLDDAINASLPDSFATQDLRKKAKRLSKRVEKLKEDIQVQRLMDAAQIRHQHPIARVRETPALTAVAEQTQIP